MSDETLVWIFGTAFITVVLACAIMVIRAARGGAKRFFPSWEKARTLYPVPEHLKASFWLWHKAFLRYKPLGSLWPRRIQATKEGLLLRKGSQILFGDYKDYSILIPWEHLVYSYKAYEPPDGAIRFWTPHVELQIYGTDMSVILSERHWESHCPGKASN